MIGRASTSTSISYQWTYDVFINFRGEDTRYGFTGNLYKALCEKGIRTFIDDEELQKGADITPALLNAIEQSRMAITVFSKNYASCLDELVKIIQCIKGNNRPVWPIFYDVEPSGVRHQNGNYKEALAMHLKTFKADLEKVKSWKWALNKAANASGLHFRRDQYEHQLIERIVQEISSKISRVPLHIAEYPVGLDSRVSKIKSLLRLGSKDEVDMVGICGIGGMGKTTIARAVYNSIADHFEGLCFLHDIKENSRKLGLEQMQERMLSKILGVNIKVEDVNEGIPIIKRRFNQKKILLILDNVDKREQLENLGGECNWFGFGSRIIITTRDKQLLARHGVDQICELNGFNYVESLQFLKWNMFRCKEFDSSYKEVLDCVVHYAQGLPLALQVIGSHLFGMSIKQCKVAIDMYRRIPNEDIQKILKVSYNSLTEIEQEIFLDIACFYKGEALEYVENMVKHAHDFDPSYGIQVLINKCLIKIEYGHIIRMHDLIQDMGREIVRQESPREPGDRSRLWFHMDILHVLENNTGSDKINALIVKYWPKGEVNWDGEALKKMKNLKILILEGMRFSEVPKYLPNSLRVLHWWGYPASCFPVDFHPTELAKLDWPNSCLQSLPGQPKRFENFSVLDLSECPFITNISDMSGCPNLTELSLEKCKNLVEIHDSVGYLRKLQWLSVYDCENLRRLPHCLKLPDLEVLLLAGCSSLEKFPEIQEKMECITRLDLSGINVELPFSICNLTALEEITIMGNNGKLHLPRSTGVLPEPKDTSMEGCEVQEYQELSSTLFSNVKEIFLKNCNISEGFLRSFLTRFVNVKHLDLRGSNFLILPACIKECCYLESLDLSNCMHLREVRGIPPNIEQLHAMNCRSLNSESRSMLLSQELHDNGNKQFWVSGSTMPGWVSHRSKRPSLSFWFRNQVPTISFCCVLSKHLLYYGIFKRLLITVSINGDKIKMCHDFSPRRHMLAEDVVVLVHVITKSFLKNRGIDKVSLASEWNHVEVKAWTPYLPAIDAKEVGIYVKGQENRKEDFQFINPHK